MDIALAFVDSCCYVAEGTWTPLKEFWTAYKEWSLESGLRCLRRRDLLSRLEDNFQVSESLPLRVHGLVLRPEEDWDWWDAKDLRKVYLISDGSYTKIGVSVDPPTRMEFLQVGSSSQLSLVHCWLGSYEEEAQLHKRFEDKRHRGEWFDLSPDDIAELKERV